MNTASAKSPSGAGLRGSRAAYEDDRFPLPPMPALQRHPARFQYRQEIGEGELVAEGKCHDVELRNGTLGFQGAERQPCGAQRRLEVRCGRKDPLAGDLRDGVQQGVEDSHGGVGHSDFVQVRV